MDLLQSHYLDCDGSKIWFVDHPARFDGSFCCFLNHRSRVDYKTVTARFLGFFVAGIATIQRDWMARFSGFSNRDLEFD